MAIIRNIANPERVKRSQETRRSNAAGFHESTAPKREINHMAISEHLYDSDFPPGTLKHARW